MQQLQQDHANQNAVGTFFHYKCQEFFHSKYQEEHNGLHTEQNSCCMQQVQQAWYKPAMHCLHSNPDVRRALDKGRRLQNRKEQRRPRQGWLRAWSKGGVMGGRLRRQERVGTVSSLHPEESYAVKPGVLALLF